MPQCLNNFPSDLVVMFFSQTLHFTIFFGIFRIVNSFYEIIRLFTLINVSISIDLYNVEILDFYNGRTKIPKFEYSYEECYFDSYLFDCA